MVLWQISPASVVNGIFQTNLICGGRYIYLNRVCKPTNITTVDGQKYSILALHSETRHQISMLHHACDSCVVLQLVDFFRPVGPTGPITLQLTFTLNFGSRGVHLSATLSHYSPILTHYDPILSHYFMKQLGISCPARGQQISCPQGD